MIPWFVVLVIVRFVLQLAKNVKNTSMILLNRCANKKTYLRLKKQRYHCRSCHKYFTVRSYLVSPSCFISILFQKN